MMPVETVDFSRYFREIEIASPVQVKGRVKEVIGLVVRASLPQAFVGELCLIYNPRSRIPVKAEVVGFQSGDVLLMPIGELTNIGPQSEVEGTGACLTVKVGEALLGRVLNGLGEPMEAGLFGQPDCDLEYPVYAPPPDPLRRRRVDATDFDRCPGHRRAADMRRGTAHRSVRSRRRRKEHAAGHDRA